MHKSPFDIATLLYKHKTGSLTQESEIEQLREWISASSENENLFNNLSSDCSFEEYSQRVANYNVNDAWNNLLKKKQKQKNKIIFKTYLRYAASIALIIGISVGSFIWYKGNNSSNTFQSEQIVQNKIVPGKSKAILTLPTGEQIALEDENTLISDRIAEYNEQTNTEAISFSTIETPQGGEYRLKLSDGSHISLNSQSKVRFPDKFPPDKREIELLQGEVFLDVIPSTNSPFTVKMKDMTVKVTGTSFNISTYEQVYETTLVSGSVEVSLNTGKTYRLRPSQQLSNKAGNSDVIIKEVDTDLYTHGLMDVSFSKMKA